MCGICGVVGIERSDEAEAVVRRMMAAMGHRGPDDEGLLVAPPTAPSVALGLRRLSIIDLAGGHQPIFNEEGTLTVVFNGEIYNFRELRRQFGAKGHRFRTRSDTEAIVHAYEQWGEDCVRYLRGMFAFAVLDMRLGIDKEPRLFLARDRLGIKPLYYAFLKGAFVFASEVRALLASGLVAPRLSAEALESYLLFGSVAEPMTLVEGVFSLPPGHRIHFPVAGPVFEARPEPYWEFGDVAQQSRKSEPQDSHTLPRQLRTVLEDAVRSHLIADVPLGIFLSSGLDSTAIAALASRELEGMHTFTVVFPELDFSEAALARRSAEHFGTRHEELMLSGEDLLARLEEAVAALDQPTMDGINTYFVSWAARQVGLKVALSGLGGDEVFGGYSTFRSSPRVGRLAALGNLVPRDVRSATAFAAVKIAEGRGRGDAARKLAALWSSPDSLPHPYFFVRALFTPEQSSRLLTRRASTLRGEWHTPASKDSPWRVWLGETVRQADHLDSFTGVSCLEMRSYMVNTLLRDTDAVSMSHSLEVRVPLLDHRLVEFVAQLPGSVKRRRGMPKALLVQALGELLPYEVVQQRKRTFTFPWERWLRDALRERVARGLADLAPALQPVLNKETVRAVWHDFLSGRTNWSRPWSLYVLNEWSWRHLEGGEAEPTKPAVAAGGSQPAPGGHSH